jgi:hypothetical protein
VTPGTAIVAVGSPIATDVLPSPNRFGIIAKDEPTPSPAFELLVSTSVSMFSVGNCPGESRSTCLFVSELNPAVAVI